MQWHITQHQEQFGLFFVEYSSHMRREDLFTALEGTYASSIITVDYSAFKGSQQTYLDEWLHEILTKKRLHQNVVAINLVGFENLLLLGEAKVLSAAERINTRTEYFKELNVPLFFWTTNQARLKVLKYASDFYSLHNDVLIVDQVDANKSSLPAKNPANQQRGFCLHWIFDLLEFKADTATD